MTQSVKTKPDVDCPVAKPSAAAPENREPGTSETNEQHLLFGVFGNTTNTPIMGQDTEVPQTAIFSLRKVAPRA